MCMTNAKALQSPPPLTTESCYVGVSKLPTKEKFTPYQLVPHLLSPGLITCSITVKHWPLALAFGAQLLQQKMTVQPRPPPPT